MDLLKEVLRTESNDETDERKSNVRFLTGTGEVYLSICIGSLSKSCSS